jgi:predicted lipoprotein with Yx(FWY)xxD motif
VHLIASGYFFPVTSRGVRKIIRAQAPFLCLAVGALAILGCGADHSGSTVSAFGNDQAAVVGAASLEDLGMVLVNSKGLTLYEFHGDQGQRSSCYDTCAKAWPPLLTAAEPKAGFGAFGKELGTTKREDGTTQVTYAGHPVYEFAGDRNRGEANGDGSSAFGGRWYALKDPKDAHESFSAPDSSGRAVLSVGSVRGIGPVLVDSKGFTIYEFDQDTGGAPTCFGGCASAWRPMTTVGAPMATGGAFPSKLGTVTRQEGVSQVTYAGHPLYTYVQDKKPGEAHSNRYFGFGGYWYAVAPSGEPASH